MGDRQAGPGGPGLRGALPLTSARGGGIEITSASGGTIVATIPVEDTADLPEGATPVYVDCVRIDPDGKPYSFHKGIITFYGSGETLT